MANTLAGFTALGFLDTGFLCPIEEDASGGDFIPDGYRRSTPQIPTRQAETLAGASADLAEPVGADTLDAPLTVSADAIASLRAAILEGQRGALREALELARADARDVEDVEILMLAA